jgi:hypothetical protein
LYGRKTIPTTLRNIAGPTVQRLSDLIYFEGHLGFYLSIKILHLPHNRTAYSVRTINKKWTQARVIVTRNMYNLPAFLLKKANRLVCPRYTASYFVLRLNKLTKAYPAYLSLYFPPVLSLLSIILFAYHLHCGISGPG